MGAQVPDEGSEARGGCIADAAGALLVHFVGTSNLRRGLRRAAEVDVEQSPHDDRRCDRLRDMALGLLDAIARTVHFAGMLRDTQTPWIDGYGMHLKQVAVATSVPTGGAQGRA